MKKTKTFSRLTAFLLSLIITLASIPLTAIAEDALSTQDESINVNNQPNSDSLIEDMSKRDSFTKHYVSQDGTRYAVVFAEQVNYHDGEQWQEVDNRMTLDRASQRYVTANPVFSAEFSASTASEQLVSMSDGEYTLSWSVLFPQKNSDHEIMSISEPVTEQSFDTLSVSTASAQILNNGEMAEVATLNTIENMGKATSALRYNGVYNNSVDLRYTVLHGKIEEDIILNSLGSFTSYTLEVNTDGLTAAVDENGSVTFTSDDGRVIFSIDAPWMMDANGEFSVDIDVDLIQRGDIAYISYTPDYEWLAYDERAYPVLIDPSFTTKFYTSNYVDTYVSNTGTAASRAVEPTMKVGGVNTPYIKILNIPFFSESYEITEAEFRVYSTDVTNPPYLSLYEVTDWWNWDLNHGYPDIPLADDATMLEYNSDPTSNMINYAVAGEYTDESSVSTYIFDITGWLEDMFMLYGRDYFQSDRWHGFKITSSNNSDIIDICASEYAWAGYRPRIFITYSYQHDEIFQDQALYSFKSNSTRYVSVSNIENDGKNVFMCGPSENPSAQSRTFRLDYTSNNSFYIKASFGEMGQEEIVKFDYSEAYDEETNSYVYTNVYLGSASTSVSQSAWRFEYAGDSSYKIVSAADPNIVLTRQSDFPGSATISSVGATGNVFAAPYINSSAQHWRIESSGIILTPEHRLLNGSEPMTVSANDIDLRFFLPTYNVGDTVTWSSANSSVVSVDSVGAVTVNGLGTASITATLTYTDGDVTYYSQNINSIAVGAGTYFMRNNNSEKYANLSGTSLTSSDLNTTNNFKWAIEYNPSYPDYYKIRSLTDNSYIGIDATNPTVIKTYANPNDYTYWKIDRVSSCVYALRCKMTEYSNMFLATNSSGTLIQSDDNDPKAYWNLFEIGFISNTQFEAQKEDQWCWVATSRMFAKNYSSNVTYTQSQAVIHVKGSEINLGGNWDESIEAINYYLSTDPNITLNIQKVHNVYSKETLVRFLDDGHVIYAHLSHYHTLVDEEVENRGAHAILIAGYTIIDGHYRFLIYDPWNPNVGKRLLVSYENLYNGHETELFSDDIKKNYTGLYLWTGCIVVNTPYSSQTVPWYFG